MEKESKEELNKKIYDLDEEIQKLEAEKVATKRKKRAVYGEPIADVEW